MIKPFKHVLDYTTGNCMKKIQEGVKLSQQMQKIEVDMLLHIINDAAAFSAVTLETQASAGLKTNPYFVVAGCSLGLLQTDYDATDHVTESRAVSCRCGGAGKC